MDGCTLICVLTHDPESGVPPLEAAPRTRVEATGSPGAERLREVTGTARLRAPIAIGGGLLKESVPSIAAEIVATRPSSGTGQPVAVPTPS